MHSQLPLPGGETPHRMHSPSLGHGTEEPPRPGSQSAGSEPGESRPARPIGSVQPPHMQDVRADEIKTAPRVAGGAGGVSMRLREGGMAVTVETPDGIHALHLGPELRGRTAHNRIQHLLDRATGDASVVPAKRGHGATKKAMVQRELRLFVNVYQQRGSADHDRLCAYVVREARKRARPLEYEVQGYNPDMFSHGLRPTMRVAFGPRGLDTQFFES